MFENHPLIIALIVGFTSGLLLSIPVGPINLTIINEGAKHGLKWACAIGVGAVVAETVYCAIAFTGFASFFNGGFVKAAMELFSFVFMLYLGIKFILSRSPDDPVRFSRNEKGIENKIEHKIEERLHPHSAFMIGLARVLGNPGVLVFWIILAANFISREWVKPDFEGKTACIFGVIIGTSVWYFLLAWMSAKGHGRLNEATLVRMERISGIILLILALGHGGHITYQLYKSHNNLLHK
ncbi:MAG TPA: LysE family transporter [Verrucomicrobiota bacterium]|nr:LysE family transporter [Verrucomicrobiota bacterium]